MAICRTGFSARAAAAFGLSALLALPPAPLLAQGQGKLKTIRDAEIEALVRDYARPIFKVAGVNSGAVDIYIVNDSSFNAFVISGRRMFINTGALLQAKTPNEIIGVIAHETGHIAGGHNARLRQALEGAQAAAIVSMLLGIGAIAAGAATGNGGGAAAAGQAIIGGGQQAAMRSLLAYRRSEEQAADRSAVRYLNATGQSAKGMVETFQRLADQSIVTLRNVDPYVLSHPMPRDRVSALQAAGSQSKFYNAKDPAGLQLRHDLMRAKLIGFMQRRDTVLRNFPQSDNSLPARYARAISRYLNDDIRKAVRDIDALIQAMPDNPYFWELKGQALLETGNVKQSVEPLRKAVSLAPNSGLIRMLYGQALLNAGSVDQAIAELQKGLDREPDAVVGWRNIAIAYGKKGDIARAELASAKAALASGDIKTAHQHAARVQRKVKRGTPVWIQADDILNVKPPKKG